jgi:hypothetical protein
MVISLQIAYRSTRRHEALQLRDARAVVGIALPDRPQHTLGHASRSTAPVAVTVGVASALGTRARPHERHTGADRELAASVAARSGDLAPDLLAELHEPAVADTIAEIAHGCLLGIVLGLRCGHDAAEVRRRRRRRSSHSFLSRDLGRLLREPPCTLVRDVHRRLGDVLCLRPSDRAVKSPPLEGGEFEGC